MEFTSTVSRWPGKIHTADYMTFPQLVEWEKALDGAQKLDKDNSSLSEFYGKLLPTSLSFVKQWDIKGLPEKVDSNNFPASPALIAWLVDSITELYRLTNTDNPN